MASVEIGGQLDLVDRYERNVDIAWHRLDGADPITGTGRLYLFFARDQRNGRSAHFIHHPAIDFARQKSERQADHA